MGRESNGSSRKDLMVYSFLKKILILFGNYCPFPVVKYVKLTLGRTASSRTIY